MLTKTFRFKNKNIKSAEVTVTLKTDKHNRYIFSVTGRLTVDGCEYYGQCLDTINKYIDDPEFKTIYHLWQLYHLNDFHAGTPEQEQALKNAVSQGILNSSDEDYYKQCCKYLKKLDLYEVDYDNKPYRYGTAWLYREIPQSDLNLIKSLLNQPSAESKTK